MRNLDAPYTEDDDDLEGVTPLIDAEDPVLVETQADVASDGDGVCDSCGGTGRDSVTDDNGYSATCPTCGGSGQRP